MVWREPTAVEENDGFYVLVPGVDIRQLPIGPPEAFVLSCIDGSSSASDISIATSFSSEDVAGILARLLALGAVTFAEPVSERRTSTEAPPLRESGSHVAFGTPHPPTEIIDLSADQQQRLLELERGLRALDHYQLLGVEPDSDPKQIRAAYHELVRVFHPDRYFGKHLGSFENKLLRVFAKLTEAYEVLHRAEARAEYDRELAARRAGLVDHELYVFDSEQEARQIQSAIRQLGLAASVDTASPSDRPSPAGAARFPSQRMDSGVPPSAENRRPSSSSSADPEARRRALARKLGHASASSSSIPAPRVSSSSIPAVRPSSLVPPVRVSSSSIPAVRPSSSSIPAPRVSSSSIPAVRPSSSPSIAFAAFAAFGAVGRGSEPLHPRQEQLLLRARDEQRDHYVALARESVARNDFISAANTLRVACSLDPDNVALATELSDLERRAAAELSSSYAERARAAAIEGRFAEAADCFERAATGQHSASLFERAAFYTLESGGDLKRAAGLAKQAVAFSPNSAKCRLTLAQVYFGAKLRESALGELERARTLEPESPVIKAWITRVKRG